MSNQIKDKDEQESYFHEQNRWNNMQSLKQLLERTHP